MSKSTFRIFSPECRFERLALKSGGKTQQEAVEGAARYIATLKDQVESGIDEAILAIAAITGAYDDERQSLRERHIDEVLLYTDRLVSLSAAFSHHRLVAVGKSLGALATVLAVAERRPCEPVRLHVNAARFFRANPELSDEQAQFVLRAIRDVLRHYGPKSLPHMKS